MGCMNAVPQNSANSQSTVNAQNNKNISYKWQWYASPVNEWKQYDERFSKQLNKAYGDNVNTFKFKFDNIEYKIDFNELTMTKFDFKGNTSVSIRKILISYKWQYSSNNVWQDYDERFSKQLNEAYANNANTFKFKFTNIEYKIDFNEMIMTKFDSQQNITMSIRYIQSENETIQEIRQPIQQIANAPHEVVVYQQPPLQIVQVVQQQPQPQIVHVVHQQPPQQQMGFQQNVGGNEDKLMMLLQKWNLEQYYNGFQATGWDDISMWNEFIKQEHNDVLNSIFKLKSGHKAKFIKYVNEELIQNGSAENMPQQEGVGGGNQITHQ